LCCDFASDDFIDEDDFLVSKFSNKKLRKGKQGSKKKPKEEETQVAFADDNERDELAEAANEIQLGELENAFPSKRKLRTSKDIYYRLKWDRKIYVVLDQSTEFFRIRRSSVHIGYKDRFLGMCELELDMYKPQSSDIPFHRIYYFRYGDAPINVNVGENGEIPVAENNWPAGSFLIWDRTQRIDLIFRSGNTQPI